jgi:hypothetical protein
MLTTLYLELNQIGDQGAQHLANALQENKVTVSSIFSRYHSLPIQHRRSPYFTLERMKSVQQERSILQMLYNKTKYHSYFPLHQLFTFPTKLDLEGNKLGDQFTQHIADALQRNKVTPSTSFLFFTHYFTPGTYYTQTRKQSNWPARS